MSAITITYGKKVPGPQDYSSESFTVTMTQDLGEEHVEDNDVRSAIDAIYQLLKQEVDQKLASVVRQPPMPAPNGAHPQGFPTNRFNGGFGGNRVPKQASPKQVSFLTTLANKRGLSFQDLGNYLQQSTGKSDPYQLTSAEAAQVIDSLKS